MPAVSDTSQSDVHESTTPTDRVCCTRSSGDIESLSSDRDASASAGEDEPYPSAADPYHSEASARARSLDIRGDLPLDVSLGVRGEFLSLGVRGVRGVPLAEFGVSFLGVTTVERGVSLQIDPLSESMPILLLVSGRLLAVLAAELS